MHAILCAWLFVASVWTMFCIVDKFRTWMRFQRWKSTVYRCEMESVVLLTLLVREIDQTRERMRDGSSPGDVRPDFPERDPE